MKSSLQHLFTRSRNTAFGLLFSFVLGLSGFATIFGAPSASAVACDSVNIVRCGIQGDSTGAQIKAFQSVYNRGSDNGHSDLKAVFRWAGADDNMVTHMNTTNTRMGTLYRNGDLKINGALVGTDASVAARFTRGSGFTKIGSGVWSRKTTTSFDQPSAPVLVHLTSGGSANFAVMTDCGNAVKFTPKAHSSPAPTPKPRPTPQPTPQPAPKPSANLTCDALMSHSQDDATNFEAAATANGTTIDRYVFDFGDGSQQTVKTGNEGAEASHAYAQSDALHTARVTVYDTHGKSDTNSNCVMQIRGPAAETTTQEQTTECKPGIPEGSDECEDQPVVLGTSTTTPDDTVEAEVVDTSTDELPHTGASLAAAGFGIFGAASIAGILLYHFATRRKIDL